MLINSLIGKQVFVKLIDNVIKGTLKEVGNQFILVDEKYINIAHIKTISETQQTDCKGTFKVIY